MNWYAIITVTIVVVWTWGMLGRLHNIMKEVSEKLDLLIEKKSDKKSSY